MALVKFGKDILGIGCDAAICRYRLGERAGAQRDKDPQFAHLLERHELRGQFLQKVNENLAVHRLKVCVGIIVDATIIHVPLLTNNNVNICDFEMNQTSKRKQWYFGMKVHIGADSKTKLIRAMATTPANTYDNTALDDLLHAGENGFGAIRHCAPWTGDFTNRRCQVRGIIVDKKAKNAHKSKVCYRRLSRNADWLFASCTLVNLFVPRRRLLAGKMHPADGACAPAGKMDNKLHAPNELCRANGKDRPQVPSNRQLIQSIFRSSPA